MSCGILLVCKVVIFRLNRGLYILLLSEIRRIACLFSNSNLRAFPAPQKCHTLLNYHEKIWHDEGFIQPSFSSTGYNISETLNKLKLIIYTITDHRGKMFTER